MPRRVDWKRLSGLFEEFSEQELESIEEDMEKMEE